MGGGIFVKALSELPVEIDWQLFIVSKGSYEAQRWRCR